MNPPQGIEALPNGQWVLAGDTHLSQWAKETGTIITDACLASFLEQELRSVRTVWDIGAAIGDHTRQYLDWGKRVVAVEPNPLAFLCLEHNCPEATCINAAASTAPGELGFIPLANAGASRVGQSGSIVVPAVRMDTVPDIPPPDFVKMDVEGWEIEALLGMEETIRTHRPILFIEINGGALAANNHTPYDLSKLMDRLGYVYNRTIYPPQCKWGDPQFDILCHHEDA